MARRPWRKARRLRRSLTARVHPKLQISGLPTSRPNASHQWPSRFAWRVHSRLMHRGISCTCARCRKGMDRYVQAFVVFRLTPGLGQEFCHAVHPASAPPTVSPAAIRNRASTRTSATDRWGGCKRRTTSLPSHYICAAHSDFAIELRQAVQVQCRNAR